MSALRPGGKESSIARTLRRYPALLFLVGAAALAVLLPSALNVPHSNPQTLAEFAPIPGQGEGSGATLGSLGALTSERSIRAALPPPGGNVSPPRASRNQQKRCVGTPPRQTEDPLSPACVGFFSGDNFGKTWQGVTEDEVRVLFYFTGDRISVDPENDPGGNTPKEAYFDVAKPAQEDDPLPVKHLRAYQRHFNERYQTYNRFVHFWVYYNNGLTSAEQRRTDATDNFNRVSPFAVVAPGAQSYIEEMAKRRVMTFDVGMKPAEVYQRFPKMIWSYSQSIEKKAALFADYICTKVVPYPVSFSGNADDIGDPRRLGMLWTNESADTRYFKELTKKGVEDCGGTIAHEEIFRRSGEAFPGCGPDCYQRATAQMNTFDSRGVTTIIIPFGADTNYQHAGAHQGYRPEWITSGTGRNDMNTTHKTFNEPTAWQHAWVVTDARQFTKVEDEPCYYSYKETEPNSGQDGSPHNLMVTGCSYYDQIRQFFTAVQASGPRLNPDNVDKGLRLIPSYASPGPRTPACFYEPNDFACIKDAMAEWWDPEGLDPTPDNYGPRGCWKMAELGKRYLINRWPRGDVLRQQDRARDMCNGWDPV